MELTYIDEVQDVTDELYVKLLGSSSAYLSRDRLIMKRHRLENYWREEILWPEDVIMSEVGRPFFQAAYIKAGKIFSRVRNQLYRRFHW